LLRELPPLDALEADVVFDQVGIEKLAARRAALEEEGFHHTAPGVHRGAQPGGPRTHDDHVVLVGVDLGRDVLADFTIPVVVGHPLGIPIAGDPPPPSGPAPTARGTSPCRIPRRGVAAPPISRPRARPRPPRRGHCHAPDATTRRPPESAPATQPPRLP